MYTRRYHLIHYYTILLYNIYIYIHKNYDRYDVVPAEKKNKNDDDDDIADTDHRHFCRCAADSGWSA